MDEATKAEPTELKGHRKEDEASQAPKGAKSHGSQGQYELGNPWNDPESNKNQDQE